MEEWVSLTECAEVEGLDCFPVQRDVYAYALCREPQGMALTVRYRDQSGSGRRSYADLQRQVSVAFEKAGTLQRVFHSTNPVLSLFGRDCPSLTGGVP